MQKAQELMKSEGGTMAQLINTALVEKADLEKMEGMLKLQIQWEANEAKKDYHEAMAEFKKNPPKIDKDKKVAYGNTRYTHASLANVVDKISASLSEYGLSASWTVDQSGPAIKVTCKITHVKGHSEETSIVAPPDESGQKNKIQQIGSTISYLQRYSLLSLTGLATYDMDDDGRGSAERISEEEALAIEDALKADDISEVNFLAYMGAESIRDILKSDIKKSHMAIESARAKKAHKAAR